MISACGQARNVMVGIDKDSPDFVADESQKAHYSSIDLIDHRLGDWKPMIGDLAALRFEEFLAQKRVRYQRCSVPDIKQLL